MARIQYESPHVRLVDGQEEILLGERWTPRAEIEARKAEAATPEHRARVIDDLKEQGFLQVNRDLGPLLRALLDTNGRTHAAAALADLGHTALFRSADGDRYWLLLPSNAQYPISAAGLRDLEARIR